MRSGPRKQRAQAALLLLDDVDAAGEQAVDGVGGLGAHRAHEGDAVGLHGGREAGARGDRVRRRAARVAAAEAQAGAGAVDHAVAQHDRECSEVGADRRPARSGAPRASSAQAPRLDQQLAAVGRRQRQRDELDAVQALAERQAAGDREALERQARILEVELQRRRRSVGVMPRGRDDPPALERRRQRDAAAAPRGGRRSRSGSRRRDARVSTRRGPVRH